MEAEAEADRQTDRQRETEKKRARGERDGDERGRERERGGATIKGLCMLTQSLVRCLAACITTLYRHITSQFGTHSHSHSSLTL